MEGANAGEMIGVGGVALSLGLFLARYLWSGSDNKVNSLEQKVNTMETSRLRQIEERLTTIEAENKSASKSLASIETLLKTNNQTLSTLSLETGKLIAQVASIGTKVEMAEKQTNERIGGLADKVSRHVENAEIHHE